VGDRAGDKQGKKGKEETQQGREGSKQEGETRGEGEITEGTDSGLHHPTTVDGESSYIVGSCLVRIRRHPRFC